MALTVAQTFLQERLKFRLREWIARHLLAEWLKPMRIYQLSFAGLYGRNPDQRIQEDTRLLGDYTADLGCGIIYSLLQIVAFVGVLWALSAQVTFQVAGHDVAIPGYMVWCAFAYASIGSGFDLARGAAADCPEWRAICARGGIPLRPCPGRTNPAKALRCMAERRTNTGISKPRSRPSWTPCDEYPPHSPTSPGSRQAPDGCPSSFRFSWPRQPISAAALSLGGLIMVAGAFSQVQGAMRWFVDNFSRLADWRAAIHRVARFREALDDLPAVEEGSEEIKRALHPEGHLAFEGVRILLPDGHIVIEDASVSVMRGERVLIVGETGGGKSTLFRAVAGLWPWGSGTILTPPPETMAFLPQRPYLPLGTLRNAVVYPSPPDAFSNVEVATSPRALRSRQPHPQTRPRGPLGPRTFARRTGAPRLRAAALA